MTPDRTLLQVELAAITSRAGAFFLDLCILVLGTYIFSIPLGLLIAFTGSLGWLIEILFAVLTTFAWLIYFTVFGVKSRGQTFGKKILNLRVIMANGSPVTWRASITRTVLILGDAAPGFFAVGILTQLFGKDGQRFGDLAAGTLVIVEPDLQSKFAPSPYKYGLHPLEEHVHSLRKMSPAEYDVVKTLCDRFVYLNPDTQLRMIKEVWDPFCKKHEIYEIPGWHPMYLMEAVVMKYGRERELL